MLVTDIVVATANHTSEMTPKPLNVVGVNLTINNNCTMLDGGIITIGRNTQIGPNCQLLTPSHPIDYVERRKPIERNSPISIGEEFMWDCFKLLQVTEIQAKTRCFQN